MSTISELFKNHTEFETILEEADTNAVNDWEMKFVDDIRARYDTYGIRMYVSQKQLDALNRIATGETNE